MSVLKRSYSKHNPEAELRAPLPKVLIKPVDAPISVAQPIPIHFEKPIGELLPRVFWVIISGGEKREKDYFTIFSKQDPFQRIKLDVITDRQKLSPDGMFEQAEYLKSRYASSSDADYEPDKLYLISDVDHFINELLRIKPRCEAEGFHLIISNSCFEVWLYYAYFEVLPNFPVPDNPLKISGKFKGWLPSVIPGGVSPTKSIFKIHENSRNARANYHEDENGIPILFSTNMFVLAEELVQLIEPELSRMIEANSIIEAGYKAKNSSQK